MPVFSVEKMCFEQELLLKAYLVHVSAAEVVVCFAEVVSTNDVSE